MTLFCLPTRTVGCPQSYMYVRCFHGNIHVSFLIHAPVPTDCCNYYSFTLTMTTGMAGFQDSSLLLSSPSVPLFSILCPASTAHLKNLAGAYRRVVENAALRSEVFETLAPNDVALVLKRTGWILTKCRVVVKLVIFDR